MFFLEAYVIEIIFIHVLLISGLEAKGSRDKSLSIRLYSLIVTRSQVIELVRPFFVVTLK